MTLASAARGQYPRNLRPRDHTTSPATDYQYAGPQYMVSLFAGLDERDRQKVCLDGGGCGKKWLKWIESNLIDNEN